MKTFYVQRSHGKFENNRANVHKAAIFRRYKTWRETRKVVVYSALFTTRLMADENEFLYQ